MVSPETQELARRAEAIYEQRLRAILEPTQRGMFVAIEPDSGDHFVGKKIIDAIQASQRVHPDRLCYVMRIGFPTAVEFGYAHHERDR